MEKWARDLQVIVLKRDALLQQLDMATGQKYSYSSLKDLTINDFVNSDAKIIFSQLQKAMIEYDDALIQRDEQMFGKFLDSLINDKVPPSESQNWCAFKY